MAIELSAKRAALALKRDGRVQITKKLKLGKQWYSNQNHCLQEREWHKFIRKVEGRGGRGVCKQLRGLRGWRGATEGPEIEPRTVLAKDY